MQSPAISLLFLAVICLLGHVHSVKVQTISVNPPTSGAHLNPFNAAINTNYHKQAAYGGGYGGYGGYGSYGGFGGMGAGLYGGQLGAVGPFGAQLGYGGQYGGYGAQFAGYGGQQGVYGTQYRQFGYPGLPGSYSVKSSTVLQKNYGAGGAAVGVHASHYANLGGAGGYGVQAGYGAGIAGYGGAGIAGYGGAGIAGYGGAAAYGGAYGGVYGGGFQASNLNGYGK